MDAAEAARQFGQVKALCDRDAGRLWGVSLYGPLMLVDETTRDVVTNGPDYKGLLTPRDGVFVGGLPDDAAIGGGSLRWGGVDWSVLRWPLPESAFERDKVLIHALFLGIRDRLGLGGPDAPDDHLDTRDGRLWLQLEWRALGAALAGPKAERARAVQDAALFRAYRRSLFKDADVHERAAEMSDGLAEYTAVVLCTRDRREALAYAASALAQAPGLASFARPFAYLTGPAYGLLLDGAKPGWRKGLKGQDDLGGLLLQALGAALPADVKAAAEARAKAYGGKELAASEDRLAAAKAKEAASIRARFVDGPVLVLPLTQAFSYSYDPAGKAAVEGWGVVYPFLHITSAWGTLDATKGALLVKKEAVLVAVRVPAPKDTANRPLKGDGWTLDLKAGWGVVPGDRKGDLELKRTSVDVP